MRAFLLSVVPAIAFKFGFLMLSAVCSFCALLCVGSRVVLHAENFYRGWAVVAQDTVAQELGYVKPVGAVEAALTRDEIIEREARANKVHPDLIRAIIAKESTNQKYATGEAANPNAAARGLMQVLSSWAPKLGLEHWSQLYDEETNIRAGAWILGDNLRASGQDVYKALVLYRVGPKGYSKECSVDCAQAYAKDVIKLMTTRQFD